MDANDRQDAINRLNRGFMRPNVYRGDAWEVSYDHGSTAWVPCAVVPIMPCETDDEIAAVLRALRDYVEGRIDADVAPILQRGVWLARLSAPGYMDCTDWTVHSSEIEAYDYLIEMYDDGAGAGDDADDGDE